MTPQEIKNHIFGNSKPGEGLVTVEKSRQNRKDDIELAEYFRDKFGGDYIVLSDITPSGVKIPDLLLTGKAIFEHKNVSTISSIDSQTKRALLQLDKHNLSSLHRGLGSDKLIHVLVVTATGTTNLDELRNTIKRRILRYSSKNKPYLDFVIIRRQGLPLYFMEA